MLLTILLNIVLTATSFYGESAGFVRGNHRNRFVLQPEQRKPLTTCTLDAHPPNSLSIPACCSARSGQHCVLGLCAVGAGREAGGHGPAALLALQLAQAGCAAVHCICSGHHRAGRAGSAWLLGMRRRACWMGPRRSAPSGSMGVPNRLQSGLRPSQIVNAAAHTTINLGVIKKVMMLARVLRMFRLLRHLRVSGGTAQQCLASADRCNLFQSCYCSSSATVPVLPSFPCRESRCCCPPSLFRCRHCGTVSDKYTACMTSTYCLYDHLRVTRLLVTLAFHPPARSWRPALPPVFHLRIHGCGAVRG